MITRDPKISVVVPHFSDLAGLDICLTALTEQSLPAEDFEIIVADNASPQGEAAVGAVVAGRARLVVVNERGAGPARNGGVKIARGEILAFIDSDCKADRLWLEAGVRGLESFDFVGGKVMVSVDDPARPTPAEAFETVFAFDFENYIKRKGFTGSGNMFCPRRVFDAVGGFRVGVSEDVDWSHRATAMGYRLGYAPDAIVSHPARRTWPELRAKVGRVNAETYGVMRDRRFARLRWALRCVAVAGSPMIHTSRVLRSRDLTGVDQKLAALGTLFRSRLWRAADGVRLLMSRD